MAIPLNHGATNKEISQALFVSEVTAKRKVQEILGAANRAQAAGEAARRGLVRETGPKPSVGHKLQQRQRENALVGPRKSVSLIWETPFSSSANIGGQ